MSKPKILVIIAQAVTFFALFACTHAPKLVSPRVREPAIFVAHTTDKPMQSYLAMNLPYKPYKDLLEQIQTTEDITLKNRGEAHITVVTPIEFDQVLKRRLSIDLIHNMAAEFSLQQTPYETLCVGTGSKEIDGKTEKAYFVVVDSPGLVELRRLIQKAFVKAGGSAADFVPENFHSHVTLGYSLRDLHFEDGVIKNKASCKYPF